MQSLAVQALMLGHSYGYSLSLSVSVCDPDHPPACYCHHAFLPTCITRLPGYCNIDMAMVFQARTGAFTR